MNDIDLASHTLLSGQAAPSMDARQAHEQLLIVNRALKLLSACNEVLIRAKSEQQLLDDICRLIVERGGYLMSWAGMAERDEARSVRPVAQCGDAGGYLERARITWSDTEHGRGTSGSAIRTGTTQVNHSFLTNPEMKPWRAAALENGYQSCISLPLPEGAAAFGVLTIYSVEPYAFNAEEAKLLEELAGNLAYGILHLREQNRREQIEQKLLESEERFRVLVEHAPEAIVVFDVEENVLVEANANAERLFECSREELMRRSPQDFYPASQPDAALVEQSFHENKERSLQGEQPVFERMVRGAKGRETLCEVRLVRLPAGSQKLIRGSFIDITERKKQEQKLKESTEARASLEEGAKRLKSILDNLFAYVALLDTNGVVQEINTAPLERSGIRREDVVGRFLHDAPWWSYDENVRSQLMEAIEAAKQGQTRRYDLEVKNDDEFALIDFQISPIHDDAGRIVGLLPTAVDITERKKADDALWESERKFRLLFESAQDCLLLLSVDGRIMDINHSGHERLGYTKEEMLGRRIMEFDSPEFADKVPERVSKIMRDGHATFQSEHVRKDGVRMPVEINSMLVEMDGGKVLFSVIRDITERKAAEDALARSEANLRAIMDNSPYLTWMKDPEGRYMKINKVYADYLRLEDAERAVGKTDLDIHPRELAEKYRADDADVMASRKQKHVEEPSFDGDNLHWVETYKTPITDAHGNVLGTVGFASDITERKLAEGAITEAMRLLEKKELAKTRFLAAAGHDLRQPLTAANLYIDTLRRTAPTQDQKEIINRLGQSMDTFKALLDALLDISKLDAGAVKPEYAAIDVPGLMIWLEESFAPMARDKEIGFRLYFSMKETLAVRGDLGLLSSVLMNLVSNAIKFTQKGGILVSARRRGDSVLFQVWDTGMGIPDECIHLIFDEFYQIGNPQRDRTSGLGLGLAIAERALALLGGKIECRSQIGRGSVFGFTLPLDSAPNGGTQQHARAALQENAGDDSYATGMRIVIVEDDAPVAEAMCKALGMMGGEVECFRSAEDALLRANIEHADYYIVDYMLGGALNGIQLLNQLRQKRGKPIHAVLVTGDTSPVFVRAAAGFDWQVLHKPVNISQLLACLGAQGNRSPSGS